MTDIAPWQEGKCRVPMWMGGCPSGHCDKLAYGHQLPREILEREHGYGGPYNRPPYCFGHCCPAHGGPKADGVRFFTDGTSKRGYQMWCAVLPDFINLQESPAGFSESPFEARSILMAERAKAQPNPGGMS